MQETQNDAPELLGCECRIEMMGQEAEEAWEAQWVPISDHSPPEGGWNWNEVRHASVSDPDEYVVAIWGSGPTLCGLLSLRVTRTTVTVRMIEGNPDTRHPLKRRVIPIGLDLAFRFAEGLEKGEVRLASPAEGLVPLYTGEYEFVYVEAHGNSEAYCYREV